ncbi:MAG: hypothetical protein KAH20_07155 [Methylococcales bacterium]|nr:hypothetical protein [Methylococcales bacterium]
MKNLRITLLSLIVSSISINAHAVESEYTPNTRVLTIPSIKIGNSFVYNAKLQLNNTGSFDIVEYSNNPANVEDKVGECTQNHITEDKFRKITAGMTIGEVNKLIGCEGGLTGASGPISVYRWGPEVSPFIQLNLLSDNTVYEHGMVYIP